MKGIGAAATAASRVGRRIRPYLYVLPALVALAVWNYYPLVYLIDLSLHRLDASSPVPSWVGLENYRELLASPLFARVLLNTIIGLKAPDAGSVRIFGQDIRFARRRVWTAIERRWGVLFQTGALWSNLTVKENVAAPMIEHTDLTHHEIDELADLKIALAGLPAGTGALKPSELSGGMIKRASLARALALDPELLFLDEPTSGLDPISAAAFDTLIEDLSDSLRLTVFMITHDLDSLYKITDQVAVIADKTVVAMAPVAELERSDHPWIRSYFHGERGRLAALEHGSSAGGTA
jgi:phospholipid/cholesterol/gamma-HCH transport system ATP-binding protein